MPTKIACSADSPSFVARHCRRCGSEDLRPLGHAHSLLFWQICNECSHVWGIPDWAARRRAPSQSMSDGSHWPPAGAFRLRGRRLKLRLVRLVARALSRTAMVAGAALVSATSLQAQTAQAPPAQQPPAASHARVFASDAGMVLNFVKPDKTADFEATMGKLREALQKSDKPERKQQAASWKVMRAAEPGPNGSVLYLFVIDPAVKGADYTVSTILAEAFPDEVQALYKRYADAYASGQNFVNLTLVSALRE